MAECLQLMILGKGPGYHLESQIVLHLQLYVGLKSFEMVAEKVE